MKTADLIGLPLDYAVILALFPHAFEGKPSVKNIVVRYPYSTNWGLAGPIIEREGINLTKFKAHEVEPESVGLWCASYSFNDIGDGSLSSVGSTPLIAAMRLLASKLGDDVDVPGELK